MTTGRTVTASETFRTGAVRDTHAGKPRPDLISPFFLMRLGEWLHINSEEGGGKYPARNWEKGIPVSRCIASAFRHLIKYVMCMDDEDHLAAVAFNVMAVIHYETMVSRGGLPKELLDMPDYRQGGSHAER